MISLQDVNMLFAMSLTIIKNTSGPNTECCQTTACDCLKIDIIFFYKTLYGLLSINLWNNFYECPYGCNLESKPFLCHTLSNAIDKSLNILHMLNSSTRYINLMMKLRYKCQNERTQLNTRIHKKRQIILKWSRIWQNLKTYPLSIQSKGAL